MAMKITTYFHLISPIAPVDLLGDLLGAIPEEIEDRVTDYRADKAARGSMAVVRIVLDISPAEAESVARTFRSLPGLPPCDVEVGRSRNR